MSQGKDTRHYHYHCQQLRSDKHIQHTNPTSFFFFSLMIDWNCCHNPGLRLLIHGEQSKLSLLLSYDSHIQLNNSSITMCDISCIYETFKRMPFPNIYVHVTDVQEDIPSATKHSSLNLLLHGYINRKLLSIQPHTDLSNRFYQL